MEKKVIRLKKRRVFLDVDVQKDFFLADGNHCIRNHRRVLRNVRRIAAWARKNRIKSVSTLQAYSPGDTVHGYCLEGSSGYGKIRYTIRDKHVLFQADGSTDLPRDMFNKFNQIVLMKRCENPFDEPRADRILTEIRADEFVVVGANAEYAVLETVLGLLQRGKRVTVISDAVGYQNRDAFEIALRKMITKGAEVIETKDLAGVSKLEKVYACGCDRCLGKLKKHSPKIGAA